MKRVLLGLCCVLMLLSGAVPVAAADYYDQAACDAEVFVDTAGLLDDDEAEKIDSRIAELSEKYASDILILLVQDYKEEYSDYDELTDMSDPFNLIEEYYYQNGYNLDNGIIIMVSMEERDWALCRFGDVQEAIDDDYGYEYITDRLQSHLSDDEYYSACAGFLDDYDQFMQAWEDGEPYSSSNTLKTPGRIAKYFAIAIGVSIAIALFIVIVMKEKMNTAKPKPCANEYVKKDSFVLTNEQDLYLYSQTTKTEIPKDDSSGSDSGSHSGSHGGSGGSGKF